MLFRGQCLRAGQSNLAEMRDIEVYNSWEDGKVVSGRQGYSIFRGSDVKQDNIV